MKIALTYIVGIIAVLGIGFWLFQTSKPKPAGDLPGQAFEIQGQTHIPDGTEPSVPYNSNPPTSGDHYAKPADWGVYNKTLPDGQLVHNLEHGGIWISYKSSVDADTVAKLQDFAKRYNLIIVEPRDKDDAPIAFAAWGHLQNFDSFDEAAMVKFISAYYDHGPEKVSM